VSVAASDPLHFLHEVTGYLLSAAEAWDERAETAAVGQGGEDQSGPAELTGQCRYDVDDFLARHSNIEETEPKG